MLKLLDYLKDMPKRSLSKLYRLHTPGKGLLQTQVMIDSTYKWAVEPQRLNGVINSFTPSQLKLLKAIYISGEIGLSESDLFQLLSETDAQGAKQHLHTLSNHLLIFERKSETAGYYGFYELAPFLFQHPDITPTFKTEAAGLYISYQYFLLNHLIYILSLVKKGLIKVTQKGGCHQKSLLLIHQMLQYGGSVSSHISKSEFNLLYSFLSQTGCFWIKDKTLELSPQGEHLTSLSRYRLARVFSKWWTQKRLLNNGAGHLAWLKTLRHQTMTITEFYEYAKFSAPPLISQDDQPSTYTWEQLPVLVQELWFLGVLSIELDDGKILGCRVDFCPETSDENWLPDTNKELSDSPPVCLPNFELLAPAQLNTAILYQLELLAQRENDDNMTRFMFCKESVITGLQLGIPLSEFHILLEDLKFEDATKKSLLDWANAYAVCSFQDVLILKISDLSRLDELQHLPQFMEYVREPIPGYGFIVPRANEENIKHFLKQFGLFPGNLITSKNNKKGIPFELQSDLIQFPVKNLSPVQFHEPGSHPPVQTVARKSRYIESSKEPTETEKARLVEYAIVMEKQIELNLKFGKSSKLLIRPHHLIQEVPVKIIATDILTGFRNEYTLNNISRLSVIE